MRSNSINRRLWGIPGQFAEALKYSEEPVLSAWDLFYRIRKTYQDIGRDIPPPNDLYKSCYALINAGVIRPDHDYSKHYRVVATPDRPADDIVCLIDRFCCIAHLSAMQRWSLTDRQPHALMITRPDDGAIRGMAAAIMDEEIAEIPWAYRSREGPFRLNNIVHPSYVRQRSVKLRKSRHVGNSVRDRAGFTRVTTIGQTFLDMLRRPDLCGGMVHVLDVWERHADLYLADIIVAVDSASSAVKCRAGYIIEERLGLNDSRVKTWRSCAQRGGSRVLDPGRPYVPIWSETWMISLNA